jgi:hypothetical protein
MLSLDHGVSSTLIKMEDQDPTTRNPISEDEVKTDWAVDTTDRFSPHTYFKSATRCGE